MDAFYASQLWQDLQAIIQLYSVYDGDGQTWSTNSKLDYHPTKRITNHTRHLIMEEARFMFSRAPEITIQPAQGKQADNANKEACAALEAYVREVLERSQWARKLPMAGRDCFIGKRVALRVHVRRGQEPIVQFRPSLEFFHDVEFDSDERLTKVIFAWAMNNEIDPQRLRVWCQTYRMEDGHCLLDEEIHNGNGMLIETRAEGEDIGLPYIPVYIIVNDGLIGDVLGESDIEPLMPLQDAYNRLTSDDQDALRFNMFPQRVFVDASEDSLSCVKVSPGAMIDLQSEPSALNHQAQYGMLETDFPYHDRLEAAIERVKTDMYELLSIPKATTEDYKGMGVSGKALRALYWPLITRCDEKWTTWDAAIRWMVRCLVDVDAIYGRNRFANSQYTIGIEHLYPITEDEEAERQIDILEVDRQTRSRKGYIEKWQPSISSDDELRQIATEKTLFEDAYTAAIGAEIRAPTGNNPLPDD